MNKIDEVKNIRKGDILNESWGYDQTNNEYCQVLSNTGKTLKCQKIGKKHVGDISPAFGNKVMPNAAIKVCKPFNIRIKKSKNNPNEAWLIGSYPLSDRDCSYKNRGVWFKWDGKPDIDTER